MQPPKADSEEFSDALLSYLIRKRRANAASIASGGKVPKLEPLHRTTTPRPAARLPDTSEAHQQTPAAGPARLSEDDAEF